MGRLYIAPLLGAVAVPGMIGLSVLGGGMAADQGLGKLTAAYTGYDPYAGGWDTGMAMANYGAIAAGGIAHIICSKIGINKALPKGFNI